MVMFCLRQNHLEQSFLIKVCYICKCNRFCDSVQLDRCTVKE